ncbi:MAG: FAD-dependent monooxygenase, partial [Candidatus Eremiobacteraeota bacterium]|nr:FAD-dependent monooxygenase [Candidatus Eremiobacteraeota bacterium]
MPIVFIGVPIATYGSRDKAASAGARSGLHGALRMSIDASIYESFPRHAFRRPPEFDGTTARVPVVILGAGPVGLTAALGLARHGVRSVVIESRDTVGFGSRAICLSRRSLEIWDRLGVAGPIVARGLPWTGGRSSWGRHEVLSFAMPHDDDQKFPPMLNLQQCFVEQFLIEAVMATPEIDLRWHSSATMLDARDDGVRLGIDTPEGRYDIEAGRLVACDGARSFARRALGLALEGTSYEGRYLIADVRLASDAPVERRAWFDPPSNPRSTLLMHRQPDDVWRIDYQLRDDEDEIAAQKEAAIRARIDAHLAYIGETEPYTLIWRSLYKAHAVTLAQYVHGRVAFAGDAAHLVPIFGVRGLNSGVDDAFNLAWKLARVVRGDADDTLLESYSEERV